MELIK
jgi:serine/threonine protein kinase